MLRIVFEQCKDSGNRKEIQCQQQPKRPRERLDENQIFRLQFRRWHNQIQFALKVWIQRFHFRCAAWQRKARIEIHISRAGNQFAQYARKRTICQANAIILIISGLRVIHRCIEIRHNIACEQTVYAGVTIGGAFTRYGAQEIAL